MRHTGYVFTRSACSSLGVLVFGGRTFRCAIGRGGVKARKREGDGATPLGRWTIERIFYRPDRSRPPVSSFPTVPIRQHDGWCDGVGDRNYNRFVTHPYPASAEALWRDDPLYDVIGVLSHNRRPRVQGLGSAVFLHVAKPSSEDARRFVATAGCIALNEKDLQLVLAAGLRTLVVGGAGVQRTRRGLR